MHVLSATNNLYPDPEATGSGRYNYEVGRELIERGHDVSVVTRLRGDAHARETVDGMDVYRYDASIPRLPATLREIDRTVASIESNAPVDVVSFHGALSSFGVDRAISNRIPRTYTIHGLWAVEYRDRLVAPSRWAAPPHRLNRALRHRIEARVLDHSDAAIVLSEFMRERLRDHHPGAPSCSVVPGGVDVERFAPIDGPGPETFAEDETSFLTVRRLTPRMGLETLLDAFASVVADATTHTSTSGRRPAARRTVRASRPSRYRLGRHVPRIRSGGATGVPVRRRGRVRSADARTRGGSGSRDARGAGRRDARDRDASRRDAEILGNLERRSAITEPLLVDAGDADALAARLASWGREWERRNVRVRVELAGPT